MVQCVCGAGNCTLLWLLYFILRFLLLFSNRSQSADQVLLTLEQVLPPLPPPFPRREALAQVKNALYSGALGRTVLPFAQCVVVFCKGYVCVPLLKAFFVLKYLLAFSKMAYVVPPLACVQWQKSPCFSLKSKLNTVQGFPADPLFNTKVGFWADSRKETTPSTWCSRRTFVYSPGLSLS